MNYSNSEQNNLTVLFHYLFAST